MRATAATVCSTLQALGVIIVRASASVRRNTSSGAGPSNTAALAVVLSTSASASLGRGAGSRCRRGTSGGGRLRRLGAGGRVTTLATPDGRAWNLVGCGGAGVDVDLVFPKSVVAPGVEMKSKPTRTYPNAGVAVAGVSGDGSEV